MTEFTNEAMVRDRWTLRKRKVSYKDGFIFLFMYLLWFVVDIIRHWLCSKEMMEIDWIFHSGSVLNIWIRNRVHTCTLTSYFYVSDPYLTVFACMKLIKKVSLHFCYLCTFDIFMAKKVFMCSIWIFKAFSCIKYCFIASRIITITIIYVCFVHVTPIQLCF